MIFHTQNLRITNLYDEKKKVKKKNDFQQTIYKIKAPYLPQTYHLQPGGFDIYEKRLYTTTT